MGARAKTTAAKGPGLFRLNTVAVPEKARASLLEQFAQSKGGKAEIWVQLGKTGKFAARGGFELTTEHWQSCVAQFKRWQNETLLDYDHGSCGWLSTNSKAAGWISELRVDEVESGGSELWGLTRFTAAAAEAVRAEEWKYISPALFFDSEDRETGEEVAAELFSVAMTNIPFLDGMAPLELSQNARLLLSRARPHLFAEGTAPMNETIKKLLEILGLTSEEELSAWVDAHRDELAAIAGGDELADDEKDDKEKPADKKAMSRRIASLSIALKLSEGREKTLAGQVAELSAKVEVADTKDRASEVDAAIKAGKATENERDVLLDLHKTDKALFEKSIEKRTPVVPLTPLSRGSEGAGGGNTKDPADLKVLSVVERAHYDGLRGAGFSHKSALAEVEAARTSAA
jgi:phage I-like protein